jgi:hypothetical protein
MMLLEDILYPLFSMYQVPDKECGILLLSCGLHCKGVTPAGVLRH